MAQNEELSADRGNVGETGYVGFIDSNPAAGFPASQQLGSTAPQNISVTVQPGASGPVVLSPPNAVSVSSVPGQNGWIEATYEWVNPTPFSNLVSTTPYIFLDGIVPANFSFILRYMECSIEFDAQSVNNYDLLAYWPGIAHSSYDSYLILTMNGSTVSQGINTYDPSVVGATYQYAPTVFDLMNGVDLYRVFKENTMIRISSPVDFPAINSLTTNTVGVKTKIRGILIPKLGV